MKKLFKKKKKSPSDASSLASGRSASGYNVSPKKDLPKLHKSAFENDIAKLKLLLKKGDVNQLDKDNRTALHLACAQGNAEAVRVLVSHPHCNLNLCDNDRRSALMKCVQCQFQNCLEILIQKRADVNLSDINGNTALHLASAIPSGDTSCLLLDSNANVNEKNKEGSTPLHIASSIDGSDNVIKYLIEDGAEINAADNNGKTALMLAASRGHLDIVKLLLSSSADASMKDARGWSADDYASMSGHHPISMIIFEYSQKQEKANDKRPSSGEHVYATVNRNKAGNFPNNTTINDTDDLSLSDVSTSHSLPTSEHEHAFQHEGATKPSVNVAQFMKQRQMKKVSITADGEGSGEPSPTLKHPDNLQQNTADQQPKSPAIRSRDYQSNSKKGGPVSPRKPPLPYSRPSEGKNPSQDDIVEDSDGSPWDEEDVMPPGDTSNRFMKPDHDVMKNLGLTAADVNAIYDESSVASSSTAPSDRVKDADVVMKSGLVKEQSEAKLDDSETEQDTASSAWDEDDSATSVQQPQVNFLASSLLKFDDELSDSNPASTDHLSTPRSIPVPSHSAATPRSIPAPSHSVATPRSIPAPSHSAATPRSIPAPSHSAATTRSIPAHSAAVPQSVPALPPSAHLREEGVLFDSDESSFDSTKIGIPVEDKKADMEIKQDSKVIDLDASSADEDASDEISTESESEWERENRHRRQAARSEMAARDSQEDEHPVPIRTKMATQKALAFAAAQVVKTKQEHKEEEHLELLASQDRAKIEAALQEALAGSDEPTESEASELDEQLMGNIAPYTDKMGDSRVLSVPGKGLKIKTRYGKKSRSHLNGVDPSTWTGTETESELEEDFIGVIPSSLRSSQLSDALLRSGERGDLEREAAREKRRAIDAIEQLEFTRRNVEALKEQVAVYKENEDEMLEAKNEMEAAIRKLNFEQNRLKEQLASCEVESTTLKEKIIRGEDHLEIESATRRKHEVTIRELQNELKISDSHLKKLEVENQEILQQHQQSSLHDQVNREREKAERGIEDQTKQTMQMEALNLLMREKEDELIRTRAERSALEEKCERYKNELNIANVKGEDDKMARLGRFNEELNDKVEELTRQLREREENSYQTDREYMLQMELLKQANDVLTNQVKKEQQMKEVAVQDLESLNGQQRMLRSHIDEVEEKFHKEENKLASLQGEMKGVREQKEAAERRLHEFEVNEGANLQESSNLRASLAQKESHLVHEQKEKVELREKFRSSETELNELRRESAKLHGRIEMLQADVSQQESERIRLRRELEDTRNMSSNTLSTHHGKLSDMMSANQSERIEMEKVNAQLKQQVAHLRAEVEKINEEKLRKDEDLARSQQDRIETHKHLSFTESSMAQLAESQQMLQQDKRKMELELDASKVRCASLESRVEESHQQMSTLREELATERQTSSSARRDVQSLEMGRTHNEDKMMRLGNQLKEADMEMQRLQLELSSYTNREKDVLEDRELMMRSRTQLEELVAKLQDEKVRAEEKLKTQEQRCEVLQSEASGHRKMWEEEVKARSKLSVEVARIEQERRDTRDLLASYKDKLSKVSVHGKSYRTKYENQKRHRAKLEREVDEYRVAAESRARCDSSESECKNKLSRMSEEYQSERSRMEAAIHKLRARALQLERSLNKTRDEIEKSNDVSRSTDSSVAEVERERDQLREELNRVRTKVPDENRVRAIANAQVNATLDQVNTWLEEKAVAQDILERLRFENEEKRVSEANRRADGLQREVEALRARIQHPHGQEEKMRMQQITRNNIELQDKFHRTKEELEETKLKLDHEKNKYKQLHTSALSGAVAGNLLGGAPYYHPLLSTSLNNRSSADIMTSTPRRQNGQPMLAQLRHNLDASIAMRLASNPSSGDDAERGRGRRREEAADTEYFIP